MEGTRAAAAAEADRAARRLAGRTAGVLFFMCGLIAAADGVWLALGSDGTVLIGELVGAGSLGMVAGAVMLRLPWQRWSRWASLWVVPLALSLIGVANAADRNPDQASLFFIVLALWVGIALPRGTVLVLSPLVGAVYWLSLALTPTRQG